MQYVANTTAVALLAIAALFCAATAQARNDTARAPTEIAATDLPRDAQKTLALIRAGGPFPYSRDGIAFGNREHLLPAKAGSYYHEFTVRTPGARNRGARRIICGGELAILADCYYTDDHYQSFRRIRQ